MNVVEYPVNEFEAFLDGMQWLLLNIRRLANQHVADTKARLRIIDDELFPLRERLFLFTETTSKTEIEKLLQDAGLHTVDWNIMLMRPVFCKDGAHDPPPFVRVSKRLKFSLDQRRDDDQLQALCKRDNEIVTSINLHVAKQFSFYDSSRYRGHPTTVRVRMLEEYGGLADHAFQTLLDGGDRALVARAWEKAETTFRALTSQQTNEPSFVENVSVTAVLKMFSTRLTKRQRVYLSAMQSYCAVRCMCHYGPDWSSAMTELKSLLMKMLLMKNLQRITNDMDELMNGLKFDGQVPPWVKLFTCRPQYDESIEQDELLSYMGNDTFFEVNLEQNVQCIGAAEVEYAKKRMKQMMFLADYTHISRMREASCAEDFIYALRDDREKLFGFVKWFAYAAHSTSKEQFLLYVKRGEKSFATSARDVSGMHLSMSAMQVIKELQPRPVEHNVADSDVENVRDPYAKIHIGTFVSKQNADHEGRRNVHVFTSPEKKWKLKAPFLFLAVDVDASDDDYLAYRESFGDCHASLLTEWNN